MALKDLVTPAMSSDGGGGYYNTTTNNKKTVNYDTVGGVNTNSTAGTANYGTVNYNPVAAFDPVKLGAYGRTSSFSTAEDMAKMLGIDYNYDNILRMYQNAVQAENDMKMKEYGMTENKFYDTLSGTQNVALDTIRRSLSPAVANGASMGMQANNVLSSILGLQQESVASSTQLAQDRNLLIDELAANQAKAPIDATKYYNTLGVDMGTLANNKYASDVQYDIGAMDYAATGNRTLNDTLLGIFDTQSRSADNKYTTDSNSRDNKYNTEQNRLNEIAKNNTNLSIANMNNATQNSYNKSYFESLNNSNNTADFSTSLMKAINSKNFDEYLALMGSNTNMTYDQIRARWDELNPTTTNTGKKTSGSSGSTGTVNKSFGLSAYNGLTVTDAMSKAVANNDFLTFQTLMAGQGVNGDQISKQWNQLKNSKK